MSPVLAAIHAACFGRAAWSEEQIKGSLLLESTQGWIAESEGIVAGFLLCQTSGQEMEVLTFAVHPSYQRQGIGQKLLRHMLAQVPPNGVAFLEVAADNEPARALYKKCGFQETNTRKNYYVRENNAVDAVCYRYSAES